jgi:hypothetical protein
MSVLKGIPFHRADVLASQAAFEAEALRALMAMAESLQFKDGKPAREIEPSEVEALHDKVRAARLRHEKRCRESFDLLRNSIVIAGDK